MKVRQDSTAESKISWIEWMRVLGAATVVLLHVLQTYLYLNPVDAVGLPRALSWSFFLLAGTRWAVPVFFMITGALLLNPDKKVGWRKALRYAGRMAGVLATFGFVYCLAELVISAGAFSPIMLGQAILNVLGARSWDHMWYIYALLGIYLLLPVLKAYVDQADQTGLRTLLCVLGAFTLAIPTLNSWRGLGLSNLIWVPSGVFYVVLGWYAYRYLELSRRIALAGFTCVLAALAAKAMAIIVTHDYAMWIESPDDPLIAA